MITEGSAGSAMHCLSEAAELLHATEEYLTNTTDAPTAAPLTISAARAWAAVGQAYATLAAQPPAPLAAEPFLALASAWEDQAQRAHNASPAEGWLRDVLYACAAQLREALAHGGQG